jgi:peptide/nickel transport system permease protein
MVAEGRDKLALAWWISTLPGVAIMLTVMALNLFGDWLRDTLDPRLRQLE